MKYLPFRDGKYSTVPGLLWMKNAETASDKLVFQIDDTYDIYLANKKACRTENIPKYFVQDNLPAITEGAVNQYLVNTLQSEYPDLFNFRKDQDNYTLTNTHTSEKLSWAADWQNIQNPNYESLFDGLCAQVPEDIAICQLLNDKDHVAAIHLSSPNHWAPADKIGKPFNAVHDTVPGMDQMMRHYFKMLESLVQKGPFTRFAWGIATDNRLNHHPQSPPLWDIQDWQGRQLNADTPELYVRVERQNLIGLPAVNAFIFTIRTYFYSVADLTLEEKTALFTAVESMSADALQYKGLTGKVAVLRELIFKTA